MWLVGLGRHIYEAAIDNPDSLAGLPEVRRLGSLPRPWQDEDFPEWESLEYVACTVGEHRADVDGDIRYVLTEERNVRLRMDPNPDDVAWTRLSTDEIARRYPRLWTLFGEAWTEENPTPARNPPGHH